MLVIKEPIIFEWDPGNVDKNLHKHNVSNEECEEVFLDISKKIYADRLHSNTEERYILIGYTRVQRKLFIVFTVRGDKVRIISARDLNIKELKLL